MLLMLLLLLLVLLVLLLVLLLLVRGGCSASSLVCFGANKGCIALVGLQQQWRLLKEEVERRACNVRRNWSIRVAGEWGGGLAH